MHSIARQLIEISEVDALIVQTRDQLVKYGKMQKKQAADEEAERSTGKEAGARLEAARTARRRGEQEVASLREKIKKLLGQQSMVKTAKEAEALTHEIARLEGQIDELETKGLELLDAEETGAAAVKKSEHQLARMERDHAEEKQRIADQITEKQERLKRLESEQKRKLSELPEDWQESYPLMNQRMPGTVAVHMPGGQCGGCHHSLPAGTQQRVRGGEEMIRCDNCRRVVVA